MNDRDHLNAEIERCRKLADLLRGSPKPKMREDMIEHVAALERVRDVFDECAAHRHSLQNIALGVGALVSMTGDIPDNVRKAFERIETEALKTLGIRPAVEAMIAEAISTRTEVVFEYRNYRGETSTRTVIPERIWFGATEWHPEPGRMLRGFDTAKQEDRDFALSDARFPI